MGNMTGGKRMKLLMDSGKLEYRGGICIDLYNQSVRDGIAFTIRTTVDSSSMLYITEEK